MSKARCHWCEVRDESVGFDPGAGAVVCRHCADEHLLLVGEFTSWADVRDQAPPEPPWLFDGYLARGATTLLSGKPKSGKSTLACAIAQAVDADASSFVGRGLTGGPVVYVSEEGRGTLTTKLADSTRSVVLPREGAWPKPSWPQLIAAATSKAAEIEAALLAIDSLSFWSSFREGQEKDAGAAQAVMDGIGGATTDDLAVLLVHHQRKAGGEEGDAIRGSGAILGAVDLSIELERIGDDEPTQRRLVAVGRWPDTPPVLVVERDGLTGAYRAVGHAASREEAAALGMRDRILKALSGAEESRSEDAIADLLDVHKKKISGPLREMERPGPIGPLSAAPRGKRASLSPDRSPGPPPAACGARRA